MAKKFVKNVTIENAHVLPGNFKNFSGEIDNWNPQGRRTFCIELDEETADALHEEGWNVKELAPRDDDPDGISLPYIQATIRFDNIPPTIYMLTGRNNKKTLLTEDTIGNLDYVQIEYVDVILSPYQWEMKTKTGVESGIKAYVKTMYVKVVEDELAAKYRDDEEE